MSSEVAGDHLRTVWAANSSFYALADDLLGVAERVLSVEPLSDAASFGSRGTAARRGAHRHGSCTGTVVASPVRLSTTEAYAQTAPPV